MIKLLIIRNDKIGDFMLAWPSFAMLKKSLPNCHITTLVPRYTAELAKLCPWIDNILLESSTKSSEERKKLIKKIKAQQFDFSINLFSTLHNARLVWQANIPYRLAPATKLAQFFYNKRIKQHRSQSVKSEFQYNLDLIRVFLNDINQKIVEPSAPYLTFAFNDLEQRKTKLAYQLNISKNKFWIFVHIGTGGSANNLSLEQYAELVLGLGDEYAVVLTAGPEEKTKAKKLQTLLIERNNQKTALYDKNDGLVDFSISIACANLFIAGSTGPLHIAAAIDIPTVGFFPNKRSSTPLRWHPICSQGKHISFCPPQSINKKKQEDMSTIQIDKVIVKLKLWIIQFNPYLSQ
ncbi:ADP-heptose-LPS heptosyltransferase II [Candidatus Photodesmus blepharus]|uniref:ADP-heptose-LPS heptosyltransferase II n=1 Tax=Candidatus Photodesmus blepharonis TaxID=1179155 RepID=A0A084CNM0_9GAMM|nr:glycosyltransferase family 9 protein [Candidatus Photodesmus blepharus]KEY91399.1 ADP-heptose-LPS heptosyltransferase II [Candidatus Photodesmus blepharus]